MRAAFAISAVLLLAACAAAPDPDATSARNVCAIAYGNPALDPLRPHIPFDDDPAVKAAMPQLSDTARPNAAERQAIPVLDAANRRCWDAWNQVGTSPHIEAARAKVSAALGELYAGKSTFGDYNRRRAAAIAEMNAALDEQRRAGYGPPSSPFRIGVGIGVFR